MLPVGGNVALADTTKEGPEQEPCHGAWGLAPSQPAPELALRWVKVVAWLVPSDVPDGRASPHPPVGTRLLEEASSLRVAPERVGAVVDQGGPRDGGGNGGRSRPCGPAAPQTKQGVWRGSSAGRQNTTPVLGPGAGATWEQTPHCAGPERSPSKARLAAAGEVTGAGVYTSERPPPSARTHGVCSRETRLGTGGSGREDGEPGEPGEDGEDGGPGRTGRTGKIGC